MIYNLSMKGLIPVLLLSLSSCSISYKKFDYNKTDNTWVTAFKDNVFFASLKDSYQKDTFQLIEKNDAFNPYNGLSPDDLNETKRVANKFVQNIPEPAMCENCKERESYYLANCLHYYESCELDWIAKEAYRKHLKIENESISK